MATPSIREMKAALTAAGVSFADCSEKADLVARYQSAMKARASAKPPPRPSSSMPSAPPPKARAPPPPRQMRVDEMGKNEDGTDGGETGAEIRRICNCKDFYEILKVQRSCKEEDLKKAYRKSAIRLHPDKCRLTGAEDAFKKVSTAFSCLNDSRQRASYDVHGEEVVSGGGHSSGFGGFRGDVDAEELFRAFCGSGAGSEKIERAMEAVRRNPWVLLAALTVLSNVLYILQALLSRPYLLALPMFGWMMIPEHQRKQVMTQLPAMFMRFLASA